MKLPKKFFVDGEVCSMDREVCSMDREVCPGNREVRIMDREVCPGNPEVRTLDRMLFFHQGLHEFTLILFIKKFLLIRE